MTVIAKIKNPPITIQRLWDLFTYDPDTGIITREQGRVDFIGPLQSTAPFVHVDGYRVSQSRLAWTLYYGEWPTHLVDHQDGDRSNNRIKNLREATHQQNQFNKVGVGQYPKGVVLKDEAKRRKPWAARARINGVRVTLGHYATMEEAAEAYRQHAAQYQGEFALHVSLEPRQ